MNKLRSIVCLMLLTGLTLAATSCIVTNTPPPPPGQVKKSPGVKTHPHGGPPGQMKKSEGHPGKRH